MPTATDLVTDLPADFEVFGQAVATSMADLLGGSSGYILSKASGTDMDFTWIANDQGDITGVTAGNGISVTDPTGPVPTVAIDTAITADLTTAQTLTNKTLTSPALTTPTISTLTTNGDLLYGTGSGALQRKAIGTTGQVLTVAAGIPSWATPAVASSGMTLIKRASFSAVANTGTTFDSMFSATYDTYLMVVEDVIAVTEADDFYFQFRYAGPTTQTSANKFAQSILLFGGTQTLVSGGSAAQFSLCRNTGTATFPSTGQFYISRVGNASEYPVITGTSLETNQQEFTTFAGFTEVARTYTGFILSSASTNITGTVAVYGLAIA